MIKVFISYSRKDIEFARRLTAELKKNNMEFWVDWEGIPPTVDWMKQVQKGIEETDVFIFLLSPDSAKSKACGDEMAHAAKNGKRLIPITVRDVIPEEVPQSLSHLNWIFFRKQDNFEESFQKLLVGINTDFEWLDVHSRLLVRALEWEEKNRDRSLLLRGKDLHDAETQLAINTSKNPHPTDLHREYILKSRQFADAQRRGFTVLIAVTAVIMFGLGVYGLSAANKARIEAARANQEATRANENEEREIIAKNHAQAKELESKINQLSALALSKIDQNFNEALLLGVEAYLHTKENQTNNFSAQGAITKILQSNPGLIHVLLGHTDWINVVAISPDGKLLASGSWDATVSLWDISNPVFPKKLKTLTEHHASVEGVAFSLDGKTLATSDTKSLILWDVSDPSTPQMEGKISGYYTDIRFTEDNQTIVSIKHEASFAGPVVFISVSNKKSPIEVTQLTEAGSAVQAINIAFDPARNLLFSSHEDGNIMEWNIADPKSAVLLFTLEGNGGSVSSIAISADGRTLAYGSSDTTISLWNIDDPAAPFRLSLWSAHSPQATSLAFSADGNTLSSGSDEDKAPITLWDISNQSIPKKIRTMSGHSLTVTNLLFMPNNDVLISGSRDGLIMLWNVVDPKNELELGTLEFSSESTSVGITFEPATNLITSTNSDGKLAIWDITVPASPEKVKTLNGPMDIAIFSRDGTLMASGNKNEVTLWNTKDFIKLGTITVDSDYVQALEFSTDGKTLASIGKKIVLWDITDPKKPAQLAALPQILGDMADIVFNSDGKFMASLAGNDVVLWDVSNPANPVQRSVLKGHSNTVNSMAFSPTDASLFASASSDRTIILWNLTDAKDPQIFSTLSSHSDWVNTVSFSPDGTMIASGSDDRQINLWNVSNPELPALLSKMIGHTDGVSRVEFNPFGDLIASLGYDGQIIFWDINPESWAQKACSIAGGDLSIIEWNQFFPSETYRQTCEPFPVTQAEEEQGITLAPAPTAGESSTPIPVCTADQTPSCSVPSSKKLDEFCVDNNSYGLYNLPVNTTFEVLTPGFTCINEKSNTLGEPRISCTGPTNKEFQVSFCNSTCSNPLETSYQCEAGFGLNSAQGCCAPLSTTENGCVTETLKLLGCR